MTIVLNLKSDGSIYINSKSNEGGSCEEIKNDIVLNFLKYPILLDNEYTLRSYFKMIEKYPDLQKLDLFYSSFLEEYNKCPKEGCKEEGIDEIHISTDFELEKEIEEYSMTYSWHIFGINYVDDVNYGLDFLPLSHLLDIPIKIVDGYFSKINYNNIKTEEQFICKSELIMWDFIQSFIWELSFYGVPEKRNLESKELSLKCKTNIDCIQGENENE